MSRFLPFYLCAALLTASQVNARTEYRLGGVDGTPWLYALNQNEAGAYLIFDADGQQVGSVPIATAPQGSGADTLIDFSGTSIQSLFIDPMVNLTRGLPDDLDAVNRVFLPHTAGEVSVTGGCRPSISHAPFNSKMLDADPITAQFRPFLQDPNKAPGIGSGNPFRSAIVFDFGANGSNIYATILVPYSSKFSA